jgi:hypothetical protein
MVSIWRQEREEEFGPPDPLLLMSPTDGTKQHGKGIQRRVVLYGWVPKARLGELKGCYSVEYWHDLPP